MDLPLSGAVMDGIRAERFITRPGPVELEPVAEHRIKVHTGAPVTGTCVGHRFRYVHGDIDLLPAGTTETWREDQGSTSVMLHFHPALLARTADGLGLDGARVGLPTRHRLGDPQIGHLAWAMDADRRAGQPGGRLYADSLATALLAYLIGRHRILQPSSRGLPEPLLQRITDYIEAHLDQDLSLARLAGVAGLSDSHLTVQFKRATGMAVHAYVVRRRVERARTLLLQRDRPASQVALEAGFSHQSHMVRQLRRVLGEDAAPLLRRGGSRSAHSDVGGDHQGV